MRPEPRRQRTRARHRLTNASGPDRCHDPVGSHRHRVDHRRQALLEAAQQMPFVAVPAARRALGELLLHDIDLLVIENVGNLVCPAEFRPGEDARAMVCSVTEGEDKLMKYPLMFRPCELLLINKIDLLPHRDFDLDRFLYYLDQVNPGVERRLISARTGEGVEGFKEWLAGVAHREAALL